MTALYNDNTPFVADWLEALISHGHIAQGAVDRRSITDLTAADVAGHGQRHFFAGIGGWSAALRLAGVPDAADIWTGSCPCQGLSDAGKGLGFLDPRHLWPAWFALIAECRPPVILGEQVASKLGLEWLDLVFADLERCGYTVGAADLCAASVGAPHQRQRLYFVAYADGEPGRLFLRAWRSRDAHAQAGRSGEVDRMADAAGERRKRRTGGVPPRPTEPDHAGRRARGSVANAQGRGRRQGDDSPQAASDGGAGSADRGWSGRMADSDSEGLEVHRQQQARRQRPASQRGSTAGLVGDANGTRFGIAEDSRAGRGNKSVGAQAISGGAARRVQPERADATRGFWGDAEWLLCRDPTGGPPVARPVEPGTFPLAHGVRGRVGLLSGYGNAIVRQVAAAFITASLDAIADLATGK